MRRQPYPDLTDVALWVLLKEGDEAAFKALHHRHYNVLYRYGCKIAGDKELVLDCLQEVFFALWNRRATLAEVRSVRFYLMKWLKRELIRVAQKSPESVPMPDDETLGVTLSVEDLMERGQEDNIRKAAIKQALDALSPREREVVYLHFFLELTYEEICQALNLAYQVVMNYLSRALKALRANSHLDKLLHAWAGYSLFFLAKWLVVAPFIPLT